jgi:hypothetical protein
MPLDTADDLITDGNENSGNFGHAGRPGEVGGSDGGGGAGNAKSAGQKTSAEEKQRKIGSVKIDFSRDNTLPGLNKEDLDELGKPDKPVKVKKETLARNKAEHPDVPDGEYNEIVGNALYNSDLRFGGKSETHNPDYINFVKVHYKKGF